MGKLTKDTQGIKNKCCWKEGLRKWNKNLAQIINDKGQAFKRYLSTETQANEIEYNRCRATAKKAASQNTRETCNNFVTKPEHDITKPKLRAYKMIRIPNNGTVEHVKINPIKRGTWLNYFQDLWSKESEIFCRSTNWRRNGNCS
jgi:hypothetical protein